MASRAYNENDLVIIATRVARGETVDVIAKAVGRTTNAISEFLRIASNTDNRKKTASHIRFAFLLKQKQDELKQSQSDAKVKVSASDGTAPKQHRAPWTDAQDFQLLKLFATNICPDEIAAQMNRTIYSILGRLHTIGVLSFDKEQGCYYTKTPYYRVVNPNLEK
jgi:hypothetical protein